MKSAVVHFHFSLNSLRSGRIKRVLVFLTRASLSVRANTPSHLPSLPQSAQSLLPCSPRSLFLFHATRERRGASNRVQASPSLRCPCIGRRSRSQTPSSSRRRSVGGRGRCHYPRALLNHECHSHHSRHRSFGLPILEIFYSRLGRKGHGICNIPFEAKRKWALKC